MNQTQQPPISPALTNARWMKGKLHKLVQFTAIILSATSILVSAQSVGKKPNILVIWGDDIGIANISAYSSGVMGYTTPNIDRIAREGLRLQHYYGEQSCTAGRAAFLTGQHGIRTGLTKVGYPARRWA
jgi:hypothetical protein